LVDINKYKSSIAKLEEIFRNISKDVTEVSKWRCPYKNASDKCTAKFGCRNQRKEPIEGDLFLCAGSDNIDYRPAWDSQHKTTI
jgi:hypothetical protein